MLSLQYRTALYGESQAIGGGGGGMSGFFPGVSSHGASQDPQSHPSNPAEAAGAGGDG